MSQSIFVNKEPQKNGNFKQQFQHFIKVKGNHKQNDSDQNLNQSQKNDLPMKKSIKKDQNIQNLYEQYASEILNYLDIRKKNNAMKQELLSRQTDIERKILFNLNNGKIGLNGTITYQDGYTYQGQYQEFQNGIIINGYGELKYNGQEIYQGEFKNNKFDGKGTIKQNNKFYNLINWKRKNQTEIHGIFEDGILIEELETNE